MISIVLGALSGVLICMAQLLYITQIVKGTIKPSVLSWFGWFLLMGVSLLVQVIDYGWNFSLSGLALSTFGCLAICIIAVLKKQHVINAKDWYYLIGGCICIGFYALSKNPFQTTCIAVLADAILGIPMLLKAVKSPETEKTHAWSLGLASWIFGLINCVGEPFIFYLFPIYLFLYNGAMSYLTFYRKPNKLNLG